MLSTEIVQFQLTNKGHKNYIIIKLHKLEEGILWRFFMRWKKIEGRRRRLIADEVEIEQKMVCRNWNLMQKKKSNTCLFMQKGLYSRKRSMFFTQ